MANGFEQIKTLARRDPANIIPLTSRVSYNLAKAPHAIIAGGSGSGKSYFMNYLLWMLSFKDNLIFIADPKKSDLGDFGLYMPEDRVQRTEKGIVGLFDRCRLIMEYRYVQMSEKRREDPRKYNNVDYRAFGLPAVVFVMDEMAAFVSSIEDKKTQKHVDMVMKQLVNKGRQAGVFFWSIMQHPSAENVKTEVRDQVGMRVVLGQSTSLELGMMFSNVTDLPPIKAQPGVGYCLLSGSGQGTFVLHTPRLPSSDVMYDCNVEAFKRQFELTDGLPDDFTLDDVKDA